MCMSIWLSLCWQSKNSEQLSPALTELHLFLHLFSNAHYLKSLSFRMFIWTFWLFKLCHVSLFLCLYNVSWGWYCWKSLAKSGGFRKKLKTGGWPYRGGVYRRGNSNFLHTMVWQSFFSILYIYFQMNSMILPITFGYKLFPFSHYILQIGIYIPNVP